MKFNSLPKELKGKGLTLEFINAIDMKTQYSPGILKPGGKPAHLVFCGVGYWIKNPYGGYMQDNNNNLLVLDEQTARIARALYLQAYQEQEKEAKVQQLISNWTDQVKDKIFELKHRLDNLKKISNTFYPVLEEAFVIAKVAFAKSNPHLVIPVPNLEEISSKRSEEQQQLKSSYKLAIQLLEEEKIIDLLELFGIRKFPVPALMMAAMFDNKADMAVAINTFKKEQSEKYFTEDPKKQLLMYARLEIEKEYKNISAAA